jgi:REP element-mobilizing transposase RayT
MSRARKRHKQQNIRFPDKNGQFRGRRKGDKRGKKPGRKPKGPRAGSPHTVRPELKAWQPVHIVLRVHEEVRGLRKRHMYAALREATLAAAMRELHFAETGAFRIVHISIQQTHVHMLVEAQHKLALARGMQGFQISAAKHINRAYSEHAGLERRRRGTVFPDRYHEEIIKTPRHARHALAYVLNNWRKHREDLRRDAREWNVDAFSTGVLFDGWREREGELFMWRWRETYKPLVVYLPQTWLLQEGWRKAGGTIPFRYVPSQPGGGVQMPQRA